MAMNKKEQAYIEELKIQIALRWTQEVKPDILPPDINKPGQVDMIKGWTPLAAGGDSTRVERACSTSIYHGLGRDDKTSSHGSISLYSTRLSALRALRYKVEQECAAKLRRIDRMIEEEEINEQGK